MKYENTFLLLTYSVSCAVPCRSNKSQRIPPPCQCNVTHIPRHRRPRWAENKHLGVGPHAVCVCVCVWCWGNMLSSISEWIRGNLEGLVQSGSHWLMPSVCSSSNQNSCGNWKKVLPSESKSGCWSSPCFLKGTHRYLPTLITLISSLLCLMLPIYTICPKK